MTTPAETFVNPSLTTQPAKLSHGRAGWIVWTPFVAAIVYSALLAFKPTRAFAIKMNDENYPIELGTFALLVAGGIYGLRLANRARRRRGQGGEPATPKWVLAFYVLFSVALILIGMEEISWGQWFFHFETPESIARINTQQEFTLHNLEGIGGKTVWLRLAFGIGGLVGIALWYHRTFRPVAVPPKLWAWFVVITVFAVGDVVTDFILVNTPVDVLFESMREIVELIIAGAACLYLWLNSKPLLGGSATPP
jgi:hypothetical protein